MQTHRSSFCKIIATKCKETSSPVILVIEQLESSLQRGKRKIRNDIDKVIGDLHLGAHSATKRHVTRVYLEHLKFQHRNFWEPKK